MVSAAMKLKDACSLEGKLWQTWQGIKKQRHYSANKVCVVKGMVFPVVKYGYESWTVKKAEPQRIDAFELWCWRRLLRVHWTARRSNQSILKEINPEYSLEGLMLKLKLQYFGHLMRTDDSLEKSLMLGKIKGRKKQDIRGYWYNGHEVRKILWDGKGQEGLGCWVTEQQQQHGNINIVRKKMFSIVTTAFYFASINLGVIQFLNILANICYYMSLWL